MKKALIISPYFAPSNAADMQRIRMSLPYFSANNWEVELVTVDTKHSDFPIDPLLLKSIPSGIIIHKVGAFSKKWTSKFGLGSIALRSLYFYRKKVNTLLSKNRYDLIYFSTTQFPVCILGAYWKKKFGIPYVIDIQDMWHSDYYQNKPKAERPKKYWFSYRLNKYLEPIAMKHADGIISVSKNYIDILKQRYPNLQSKPTEVITFGAFDVDFEIAEQYAAELDITYQTNSNRINLVYVGRGGHDMRESLQILFECFKEGLNNNTALFERIHFNFIGTSYAPAGTGVPTIKPIADEFGMGKYVTEITDRIGFFKSIRNLQKANGLLIIGSNDGNYTASKLFPYILTGNHILAILHTNSSAGSILKTCNAGELITLQENIIDSAKIFKEFIDKINMNIPLNIKWEEFEPYTAAYLTKKQTNVFNQIIAY
ncbi:MAG: glycosyltransferase [Bacteroidota bacterium]